MKEFKDISFGWKDYLFDLYIAEDRFDCSVKNPTTSDTDHKNAAATALAYIINNRRGSPEISSDTLEQVLLESGIHRAAILDAHGIYVDGVWNYCGTRRDCTTESDWEYKVEVQKMERGELVRVHQFIKLKDGFVFPAGMGQITEVHPVDSWIKKNSGGRYGALVMNCCNELGSIPNIKDTSIFYADGNIGPLYFYKTRLFKPP